MLYLDFIQNQLLNFSLMALPSSSSSGAEKSLIRLHRAFKVDEAINTRKKHIVIIRFGNEDDPTCEEVDEWLEEEAKRLDEKDAVIYIVENESVPELVARFELSYDAAATIIFFLNNTVATILAGADVTQEKFKQTVAKLLQRRNRTAPYVENGSQNVRQPYKLRPVPIVSDPSGLSYKTREYPNSLSNYFSSARRRFSWY